MGPFAGEKNLHLAHKIRLCAMRAWIRSHPKNVPEAILVSDAAGNFKFTGHNHQLCWVHEIRHYRKLEALTEVHRELKDKILAILYDFYKKLKLFKDGRTSKVDIQTDFDFLTKIKIGFKALNELISNTKKREHGLLAVLRYPFVPTKTKLGTYSWDVGLSLVQACRKLGISFYEYLKDRYSLADKLPKLPDLVLTS